MKKLFTLAICLMFSYNLLFSEEVEIVLGAGYENDIWYSFENGIVKTEPKDNWDMAVQTGAKDAGIRINSQKGIQLWVVNGSDEDSWDDPIDTTGMSENWEQGHNSTETWSIGAFNLGLDGFETGGDFGWGMYNMATHSVSGSKVFVIKLADKSIKKIMIEGLLHGTYTVKWADLDGENEQLVEIAKGDYSEKLFAYLDLSSSEVIDREPPSDSWALLFGKYTAMIPMGPQTVPYAVTGVRTNPHYKTAAVDDVPAEQAESPEFNEENYSYNITAIGSDWKELDHQTFTYKIVENLSFFVSNYDFETPEPQINKIVFKEFEGSSTGRLVFELNGTASSVDERLIAKFSVYPNIIEKNAIVNLSLSEFNLSGSFNIVLSDINGNEIIRKHVLNAEENNIRIRVPNVSSGLYFLRVESGTVNFSEKLIIN